jgi:hypothetical protein
MPVSSAVQGLFNRHHGTLIAMTDSQSLEDASNSLEIPNLSNSFLRMPSVLPINTMKTLRGQQNSPDTHQYSHVQRYVLPSLCPVPVEPARQVSSSDFQLLKSVLELRPVVRLERADQIVGDYPGIEFRRACVRIAR